jgi:hypothetical protein
MDMRVLRGSFLVRAFAVGLAILGTYSQPANAQTVQGKFTLTQATRWGSTELPAGEYAYSIEERASVPLIFVHGTAKGSKSGIILSPNWDATGDFHASKLELVSNGKEMTVQSFYVAALGRVFHYYSHDAKPLRAEKKMQPLQTAAARPANAR